MLARPRAGRYVVLAGNSHKELAGLITNHLGQKEGQCKLFFKSNLETNLELIDSVRGSKDINNDLMEACILSYACKSASCVKVVLIMPYLPYSRHCRRNNRSAIECHLVAKMLKTSGVDMLITIDLYADEIQGFFEIPVENLRASTLMVKHLRISFPGLIDSVIVALDARSVHRASYFAYQLGLPMAFIHCRYRVPDNTHNSEQNELQQRHYRLVGDVKGKNAIIIGNLIDDSERFTQVAKLLHNKGAKQTIAMATHGLIYDLKMQEIENSQISQLILTNSLPLTEFASKYPKLCILDISQLLAEAIRRIHHEDSLSGLYLNTDQSKTEEDDD